MRTTDTFRMAAGGLRERKMRTALTVLGIVIGSSMIVALYASTQGQTASIQEQLGKLGPTTLLIRSQGNTRFDANSLETVLGVDGVKTAFLSVNGNVQATRAGITGGVSVIGLEASDIDTLVRGLAIAEGDFFADGDMTAAFIGIMVASPDPDNGTYLYTGDAVTLATTAFQQGRTPTTTSRTFTVSGVAAEFGAAPYIDVDNTVFVSTQTAQQLFRMNTAQYNQIVVIAQSTDQVATLQTTLRDALGTGQVLSGTQLASTISGVYESIGALLGSVAAISLIVAGVGIANTMFVSVLERTAEIGTLKALGFKAREIMSVFLLEAGLTGLIGGVIGCVLGVGIAFGIGKFITISPTAGNPAAAGAAAGGGGRGGFGGGGGGGFGGGPGAGGSGGGFGGGGGGGTGNAVNSLNLDATPVFTLELFLMAIAFAVVIALVAGLIPSRKAAKLDPVVALKRL